MEEHNFYLNVRYGLSQQLCELEWNAIITSTDFDNEERFVESFRAFYHYVRKELGK